MKSGHNKVPEPFPAGADARKGPVGPHRKTGPGTCRALFFIYNIMIAKIKRISYMKDE